MSSESETIEREELTTREREAIRWSTALGRVADSDLRALGHQKSRRAQQRAVALLLGHANDGTIRVWALRDMLETLNIYNEANFAQDMKKDSTVGRGEAEGLWTVHTYRGSRRGLSGSWSLTTRGAALAADYARLVETVSEAAAEHRVDSRYRVKKSVAETFVIKPKAARCAFCREDITEEDKAVCSCGSAVHATCLDEFAKESCGTCRGRGTQWSGGPCAECNGTGQSTVTKLSCVLRRTTARCSGEYRIVARPASATATGSDEPYTCACCGGDCREHATCPSS